MAISLASVPVSTSLRTFPVDAVILGMVGFGILSWTDQVSHFRLGVPGFYEHIFAYALFGAGLLATKAATNLTRMEMIIVIMMISCLEALKLGIVFRHPKTQDFIADMIGLSISLGLAFMIGQVMKALIWLFRAGTSPYWRP